MSIKLQLNGFDDYIKKLRKAGANVQKVTEDAILKSGAVVNTELENQIRSESRMSAKTKERILERMIEPTITHSTEDIVSGEAGIRMQQRIIQIQSQKLNCLIAHVFFLLFVKIKNTGNCIWGVNLSSFRYSIEMIFG